MINVIPSDKKWAASYNDAVASVCREKKYLSNDTGFPLEGTLHYMDDVLTNGWPQFFALDGETVVGWCDAIPRAQIYFSHTAVLGIGVIEAYRGQGLGKQLIHAVLDKAASLGLQKVELEVFSSNERAMGLYRSVGFFEEGRREKAVRIEGHYMDMVLMGKFL